MAGVRRVPWKSLAAILNVLRDSLAVTSNRAGTAASRDCIRWMKDLQNSRPAAVLKVLHRTASATGSDRAARRAERASRREDTEAKNLLEEVRNTSKGRHQQPLPILEDIMKDAKEL